MRIGPDAETIIKTGLLAIAKAEKYYFAKSCGRSVRSAPESFIQSELFRALAQKFDKLTLEERTGQLLKELNVAPETVKGLAESFRNGRIDIVVWQKHKKGKDFFPRYPIEVKIPRTVESIKADISRLRSVKQMSPNGRRVRCAFIFVYCTRSTDKTIEEFFNGAAARDTTLGFTLGDSSPSINRKGDHVRFGCGCYYF